MNRSESFLRNYAVFNGHRAVRAVHRRYHAHRYALGYFYYSWIILRIIIPPIIIIILGLPFSRLGQEIKILMDDVVSLGKRLERDGP